MREGGREGGGEGGRGEGREGGREGREGGRMTVWSDSLCAFPEYASNPPPARSVMACKIVTQVLDMIRHMGWNTP